MSSPEEFLREFLEESPGNGGRRKETQGSLVFLEGIAGELLSVLDFNPLPAQELQRRYEEAYKKPIALPVLFKELLDLCAGGHAGQVGGGYFMRVMRT